MSKYPYRCTDMNEAFRMLNRSYTFCNSLHASFAPLCLYIMHNEPADNFGNYPVILATPFDKVIGGTLIKDFSKD
jgi:hypothetical protein